MEEIEKKYELLLKKYLNGSNRQVEKALSEMINELKILLSAVNFHNINTNKNLKKEVVLIRRKFTNRLNDILRKYEKRVYSLSERKNIDQIFYATGTKLSNEIINAFIGDLSINVKEVSKRVWKVSERFFDNLNLILNSGLLEGKSANEIKLQLTRLLNIPENLDINELRRRGIVKAGVERAYRQLERKIINQKVGRGVYKSAKKNAYRLVRTEINMAYRRRDNSIRKNLPFIVGIEVKLSASHPREDICDDLQGKYPKDFNFIGWHPACICYAVPILANKTVVKEVLNGNTKNIKPIKKIPQRAENYLNNKKDKILKMKTQPYFIAENKKYLKKFVLK